MYGQYVVSQTQNKRTRPLIRSAKHRMGAKIATFGVSALMAGLLLLPGVALANEMPELDAAASTTNRAASTESNITVTAVVDHYYDLELLPAFTLVQNEALVYDFPDKPEDFPYGLNDTVHLFKADTDTESLIETENPKEACVSIALTMIDNHVRATVVFTGGYADDQIPYRLNLVSSTLLGTRVDRDYDTTQGIMRETRHDYYIRYVFVSDVYLIATDATDPKPNPDVKPDPEVKPNPEVKPMSAPQSKAENPAVNPASAKAAAAVKPSATALPTTGDNGAMAVAVGVAGAVVMAVAGVTAAMRRSQT